MPIKLHVSIKFEKKKKNDLYPDRQKFQDDQNNIRKSRILGRKKDIIYLCIIKVMFVSENFQKLGKHRYF